MDFFPKKDIIGMHVLKRQTLLLYWAQHPITESALKAWFSEAEHASWKTSSDIKSRYSNASFLKDNRVVFNIKGNDYRLVVKIRYASDQSDGVVYIRFIGTHAEYDRINAETI